MKKLWIAWEDDGSIRSRVLSRELDATYRAFTCFTHSAFFKWLRYPVAVTQTLFEIIRQRPDLLVVQNPSILLAFEAALLGRFLSFRLVIDLHTLYIQPTGAKKLIANALNDYALTHCFAVIVTNAAYRKHVISQTDRPVLVLPDKIPGFDAEFKHTTLLGRHNILYVCTFSSDEPWTEVVAAAEQVPDDTCIYISGRNRIPQEQVPKNVILTGYLPKEEYQNLLRSVDAVMVLTSADDCLVCGGYEAVAAGKPLILSDTPALRNFFPKGTLFTQNQSAAIAQAINHVLDKALHLRAEIVTLRNEMTRDWEINWQNVLAALNQAPERT